MILTCHSCPRQISFAGKARERFVRLFGWLKRGKRYFCAACGERHGQ